MNRIPVLLEIHYAFWAVLAIPLGFAGLFFILPGLIFVEGFILFAAAGFLILYVARLTQGNRAFWMLGVLLHFAGVAAAVYYVPRWVPWLGIPFAVANFYSLVVLVVYREQWSQAGGEEGLQAAA